MTGGALCEAAAQASGTKAGRPRSSAGEGEGQPAAAHSSGAAGSDHHRDCHSLYSTTCGVPRSSPVCLVGGGERGGARCPP